MADDYISRKEAMKSLAEEYNRRYALGEKGLKLAWIEKAINSVPAEQPEQKWIPCTERLPEDDEMVLVSCRTKKGQNNVNRAYYMDNFWHGSGSMSGVVAWMPLPEPYKGEENG